MKDNPNKRRFGYFRHEQRIDQPGDAAHLIERNMRTCCHCREMMILEYVPNSSCTPDTCKKCDDYVCDKPQCVTECIPMNQVIDLILRFPDQHIPLDRGPRGEVLFDRRLLDKVRLF